LAHYDADATRERPSHQAQTSMGSGSIAKFFGMGGDAGLYVGISEKSDSIDYGYYVTGTGSAGSSVGGDAGILISWGDIYIEQLEGATVGGGGGLDTPVLDIMYGVESIPDDQGVIHNLTVEIGPEISTGIVVGAEVNYNDTRIWSLKN